MGIKNLWNLLTPYCEKKPLFQLNGKAVAIDLSGWVCESLNVVDYFVHPRFYLRNLFFRTCYLLQTGIIPVFVLEGSAPPLKYGVIIKRNQLQFRGVRPRKATDCDKDGKQNGANNVARKAPTEQKRNRFHHVLKQCEELLSSMGLVCVQAPGEAEALCAYLNHDGLVYGVISQDSDCFAYGAVRVFRNFCASQKGGSVDIYDMDKVRQVLDLDQEKIVAMGLLSGCDYCPAGVPGVGREMINRLLTCCLSSEILGRIRSWRKSAQTLTELELKVDDKNVCADCGHCGKTFLHRRAGCQDCRTKSGCDDSRWKNKRTNIKTELDIKRKALLDPGFPSEAIISEFMERTCDLPTLDLEWRQPNLVKFILNIANLLQWNEMYSFLKLFPLFTRWQLVALSRNPSLGISISIKPAYIKKKRSPKGVASYEIVWQDDSSIFSGLIPDDQLQAFLDEAGNSEESLWSTIEPQDLVSTVYPDLVESFVASKTKPKRNPKRTPKKRSEKKTNDTKQKRLEEFMNVITNAISQQDESEVGAPELLSSPLPIPASKMNLNRSLADMSIDSIDLERIANELPEDADCMNLSEVIDRICDPAYGRESQVENNIPSSNAMKELLSMSVRFDVEHDDESDDEFDNQNVQRRLLLKQDILGDDPDLANQSLLNKSTVPRKRKSFFFESIDVPPPDLQDGYNEMDMFECSLMLKDQIVVPVPDEMNQTIVYDLDF
ncbi:flap endonuclease GEN [Ochlerotatus camptorhynchus]|uniref:flap endonuclease GEN n=1 Tax=Ochlerotatus camptorhynchus TaxID=644619 RepID=UPI0031D74EA6